MKQSAVVAVVACAVALTLITATTMLLGTDRSFTLAGKQALVGHAVGFKSAKPFPAPHEIEVAYLHSMIEHHGQAVLMATLVDGSIARSMQPLVRHIAISQTREMGMMQGWLMSWGIPVAAGPGQPMAWVERVSEVSGKPLSFEDEKYRSLCRASISMPGQPSHEDLLSLQSLPSGQKEKLFLRLMIEHHESAVEMSRFALRHVKHSLVRSIANTVVSAQRDELLVLERLFAQP